MNLNDLHDNALAVRPSRSALLSIINPIINDITRDIKNKFNVDLASKISQILATAVEEIVTAALNARSTMIKNQGGMLPYGTVYNKQLGPYNIIVIEQKPCKRKLKIWPAIYSNEIGVGYTQVRNPAGNMATIPLKGEFKTYALPYVYFLFCIDYKSSIPQCAPHVYWNKKPITTISDSLFYTILTNDHCGKICMGNTDIIRFQNPVQYVNEYVNAYWNSEFSKDYAENYRQIRDADPEHFATLDHWARWSETKPEYALKAPYQSCASLDGTIRTLTEVIDREGRTRPFDENQHITAHISTRVSQTVRRIQQLMMAAGQNTQYDVNSYVISLVQQAFHNVLVGHLAALNDFYESKVDQVLTDLDENVRMIYEQEF